MVSSKGIKRGLRVTEKTSQKKRVRVRDIKVIW